MAAPIVDITVNQGATFTIQVQLKNADTLDPIPITGYTFSGAVAQTVYDTTKFPFTFTVIDEISGIFHATLTAAVTNSLDFETAIYDMDYTVADGSSKVRIMEGTVTVCLGGLG